MRSALVVLTLAVLHAGASGCSVPVFYYALMRWPSGGHRLEVPAGVALPTAANAVAEDTKDGRLRAFFPGFDQPWWDEAIAGDPTAALADLCGSPARRELVHRLARADTSVWILLESGDHERDAAAAALLEQRFAQIAAVAKLPDPAEAGEGEAGIQDPALPPRLAFSLLKLRRGDAAEAALQAQLLHVEKGLDQVAEPMAFPVFGRGRVLPPLHGESLAGGAIDEACLFLVGSCSCEVKELNPGLDLLLDVDWDEALAAAERDAQAAPATNGQADAAAPSQPNEKAQP